jgi:glycosyltransferase involved in cell wall biosynthesis
MAPKHVDILSQHPGLTFSYSRVAREVGLGLQRRGARVRWLGVVPQPAMDVAAHDAVVSIGHADAQAGVERALDADRPDVLLTIGDPWMFAGVPALCRARRLRWAAYFAVDAAPFPGEWHEWARSCNVPMVFSSFAAQTVARDVAIAPRVIPHGVDTSIFFPRDPGLSKRAVGVEGFVVGTVAANQQRKNLPALLRAFERFARGKHDVQLYLHTPSEGTCWNLAEMARRLGIEPLVRTTLGYGTLTDHDLATVYSSFDVFVLPTMAEGFGLPILEAQACGVPALATDCSACSELLRDPFQRLPVRTTLTVQRNLEYAIVDEDAIVDRLERLYADASVRNRLKLQGVSFARTMTWQHCADAIHSC